MVVDYPVVDELASFLEVVEKWITLSIERFYDPVHNLVLQPATEVFIFLNIFQDAFLIASSQPRHAKNVSFDCHKRQEAEHIACKHLVHLVLGAEKGDFNPLCLTGGSYDIEACIGRVAEND